MSATHDHALSDLLSARRRYDAARQAGDIGRLADARFELDRRRADMRSILNTIR